ncbi:motility associated factor glycosyltransferase family protein [Maridesulfovibrio bastinii]|uniref:motility associated factor glycosyltransferase family protein n=1 Tax=Maridesulfovibrio bastinii TaxID=47157 RepID=UPI000400CAA2|nr:6-hydroxymethylpterin diphosphokinase MptE-like protein [Maridesulfovibrio bastinii]
MTAYPFLKDNIETLKTCIPPFYAWLSSQDIDEEKLKVSLFKNHWGILDWKMEDGKGLFEAIMPNAVYKQWNAGEKPHTSATFIVGCNIGYGLNHILVNSPDTHKIVVVEPNPEILIACLGQSNFVEFIKIGKLHFAIPDPDYLFEIVRKMDLQFIHGRIHLRSDMPSRQMGPEYAQLSVMVKNKLESFSVEMNTLRLRQDLMVGNELDNFSRTMKDGKIAPMKGSAKGLGAVILGAGPSLQTFGPELAKNPGHVLYTTALQSMPAVYNVGLKPHFCLAIDFNDSMMRVFDQLDMEWAKDIPLIYSTKVRNQVVERYPGPTIPMWTVGGLGTFVFKGNEEIFDAGGNVSVTLTRFLNWCDVSHILLVGQDYAWKGMNSHSKGHHTSGAIYDKKILAHTEDAEGNPLTSTVQYMAAKREMEDDISKFNTPVFNLYGGAAVIEGSTMVDMHKVHMEGLLSSAPGSMEHFMAAMDMARTPKERIWFEARGQKWSVSLRHAEKRLEKLFKKCTRNQQEIHKTIQQIDFFIRQDPLYLPYLYNEVMDMAGMARAKLSYKPKDLPELRKILKRTMQKVRKMDKCLAPSQRNQAA